MPCHEAWNYVRNCATKSNVALFQRCSHCKTVAERSRENNVSVVDVRSGALLADQTVILERNHIARLTEQIGEVPLETPERQRPRVLLIPGLWDMHVHLVFGDWFPGAQDITLPLLIANGVTGVRDMGSELAAVQDWRNEIEAGRLLGPRIFTAGPMLDGPKPRFPSSIAITTPEDGRRAVDTLKQRGADFIKLQSLIPREAVFAIAEEAKKQEISFEGHVPTRCAQAKCRKPE
jgi:imidazolonepropionase-like amidohydrolase